MKEKITTIFCWANNHELWSGPSADLPKNGRSSSKLSCLQCSSAHRDDNAYYLKDEMIETDDSTRPWGRFYILDEGGGYKVKRIEVEPGHRLSLQRHKHRSETWTIVSGKALLTIGEDTGVWLTGETAEIPVLSWHRIANREEGLLVIIEVQKWTGVVSGEEDIERKEDDYERAEDGNRSI